MFSSRAGLPPLRSFAKGCRSLSKLNKTVIFSMEGSLPAIATPSRRCSAFRAQCAAATRRAVVSPGKRAARANKALPGSPPADPLGFIYQTSRPPPKLGPLEMGPAVPARKLKVNSGASKLLTPSRQGIRKPPSPPRRGLEPDAGPVGRCCECGGPKREAHQNQRGCSVQTGEGTRAGIMLYLGSRFVKWESV